MFLGFRGLPREPQEAQEGSQEAPKELQNPKKGIQKFSQNKQSIFGQILGQFWGPFWDPKLLQKGTKNGTTFGILFPRISGVQITPRQKFNERGEKPTGAGIILNLKKGGIRPYKAL